MKYIISHILRVYDYFVVFKRLLPLLGRSFDDLFDLLMCLNEQVRNFKTANKNGIRKRGTWLDKKCI
jgi:hypothetical protein